MIDPRLEALTETLESHMSEDIDRWDQLLEAQERNTESIRELTESTRGIAGLLEAWTATQGAIKVGSAMAEFIKWAAGVAVVGTAVAWVLERLA